MSVHAVELEGDRADPLRSRGRPEDPQPRHRRQALEGVSGDPPLVLEDALHADRVEPSERGGEADRLCDRRRSGLEAGRRVGEGGSVLGDLADHRAAAEEGGHLAQQVEAPPEHPDAGRAVGLVAGGGVEVDPELAHVHAHLRQRLGAVDEDQRSGLVGIPGDLRDRVVGAEHVGDVGDGDELRLPGEGGLELVHEQLPVVVDPDPVDHGAGRLGELLPGHDVGVVLHVGQHDPIAGADVRRTPGAGDQVDGLGRVANEGHLAPVAGADPVGDGGAGPLVGGGRLGRERVRAAVDVGVVAALVAVDGLDRGEDPLRARPGIQVDERLVADQPAQGRKRIADPPEVEAGGSGRCRLLGCDGSHLLLIGRAPQALAATSSLIQP